jgi:hypothetical protein
MQYVCNLIRSECRDLTFGDTEMFLDTKEGANVGGGYFSHKESSIWFNNPDGTSVNFYGNQARELRAAAPLKHISRNDNNGEW